MMKPICTALVLGALAQVCLAAPPAAGTVADNVGFSYGSRYNGLNYEMLTRRELGAHSDSVLALVFATPW